MSKIYAHLTLVIRSQISLLWSNGSTQSSIARTLNLHKSTVSRELKRNSVSGTYSPQRAHNIALRRRKIASSRPKALKPSLAALVKEKLHLQWSPEQISGWLTTQEIKLSFAAIYRYIRQDRIQGGGLYIQLRHRGKPYKTKPKNGAGVRHIPNRVGIEHRSESVALKDVVGHWEGDLIIGASHKGAILTYAERHSKYLKIALLSSKEASKIVEATKSILSNLKDKVLTITFDNGGEFSHHAEITDALKAEIYFANPY